MNKGYGDFIKRHRISSGFKKQKDLADRTGISAATISRIEKEIQRPEVETLQALSQYLETTSLVELMVVCGYWNEDELLEAPNPNSPLSVKEFNAANKKQTPASNEEEFVDGIVELSDNEILEQFDVRIDGRSLTKEETKALIAYARILRQG